MTSDRVRMVLVNPYTAPTTDARLCHKRFCQAGFLAPGPAVLEVMVLWCYKPRHLQSPVSRVAPASVCSCVSSGSLHPARPSSPEKPAHQPRKERCPAPYLDYAIGVIVSRAPARRPRRKPEAGASACAVRHAQQNNDWNQAFKKSARIVGDVMGRVPPARRPVPPRCIVRITQDLFRHLLIRGPGQLRLGGRRQRRGDALHRIRLHKIAHEMLADLEGTRSTSRQERRLEGPTVLPTRLPNLLVNGSAGIAVGMATNIPPHNLNGVIDAITCCTNPAAAIDELMEIIQAPDPNTAGIIYGLNAACA
ncbi:MAG: hypothetical protein IPP50_22310, partial [Piscinibacter sp.]|nr:hypothetical protein [Piscinibacter sp.]